MSVLNSEDLLLTARKDLRKAQLMLRKELPLEVVERMTQDRIRRWYEYYGGDVYCSFSAGKHSNVLLHIVRNTINAGYKNQLVPGVFFDTGLEYPSIRKLAQETEGITMLRPEKKHKEILDEYGFPVVSKRISRAISDVQKLGHDCWSMRCFNGQETGRYDFRKYEYLIHSGYKISNKCCYYSKHEPAKRYFKETGRVPFVGTLAEESNERKNAYIKVGCNGFQKEEPTSNPLSFWSEQHILEYHLKYNLKLANEYGDIISQEKIIRTENGIKAVSHLKTTGVQSTGCVYCAYGCHMEKGINRFQRLYITHPKHWKYCMYELGMKGILDYMNIPTIPTSDMYNNIGLAM